MRHISVLDPFEEGFDLVLNLGECQSVAPAVSCVWKFTREHCMIIELLFKVILFDLFVNLGFKRTEIYFVSLLQLLRFEKLSPVILVPLHKSLGIGAGLKQRVCKTSLLHMLKHCSYDLEAGVVHSSHSCIVFAPGKESIQVLNRMFFDVDILRQTT